MARVKDSADERQVLIETALRSAFQGFLETRSVEVIIFSSMTAINLSHALIREPSILKPLLAVCNIAGRALDRDLGLKNVDTYVPKLVEEQALVIAGYIKPFLPPFLELPALACIDRVEYIDKEIRKGKGRWEQKILEALNRFGGAQFKKRTFMVKKEIYELDAACPASGEIEIGIDVKRIEAKRDIHKRCDEIVNKAAKFKTASRRGKFGVVVYYPFIDVQINVESRLRSKHISGLVFASETDESIETAVRLLLPKLQEGHS
ncbi:MAG: hypothetical protein ABW047_16960 [Nitrospiraceae bacterium]